MYLHFEAWAVERLLEDVGCLSVILYTLSPRITTEIGQGDEGITLLPQTICGISMLTGLLVIMAEGVRRSENQDWDFAFGIYLLALFVAAMISLVFHAGMYIFRRRRASRESVTGLGPWIPWMAAVPVMTYLLVRQIIFYFS